MGIEQSRNLMTVRLAQDLGMPIVSEYANRFRVYDELPPMLSMSLGAGETTLLRMTTAYCMFANGGKQVTASFIDRIQDRYGTTIWTHDQRECPQCKADRWQGQDEPELIDSRRQVIDPMTAYQMTSILGRRGYARHRNHDRKGRETPRGQDGHDQRRKRRLVCRLLARSGGGRVHRL